ncbi:acyltransferase family protein [Singulisphaera sp. PoT]|uniref:acyltransferase family protein n=1 Tax=Singulisphaera sp. PoT TaxID=3411797 RepID=UPI003BF5753D
MGLVARADRAGARPRIGFLDGLRGLAAIYVVLHHAALMVAPAGLSGTAQVVRYLLRHGHYAVSLFVVLSGFGLMQRVLVDGGDRLPGGTLAYVLRRARRILPPYYAALGLTWLLIALIPALGEPGLTPWDRALPAFSTGSIVAHLLLIHNLDGQWIFRVAPPFWSLATEWQAFLLFPALLAARRRWGITAAVASAVIAGEAIAALSVPLQRPALRVLCPWYLGLLAMGMAGAVLTRQARIFQALRAHTGLDRALVALVFLSTGLAWWTIGPADETRMMVGDLACGLAITALAVRWSYLSMKADAQPWANRPRVLRCFEGRFMVASGRLSYSLYLTHYPILALANLALRAQGWGSDARLAALILIVSPSCLLLAELFRRLFESPQVVGSPAAARERLDPVEKDRVLVRTRTAIEA